MQPSVSFHLAMVPTHTMYNLTLPKDSVYTKGYIKHILILYFQRHLRLFCASSGQLKAVEAIV